MIYKNHMLKNYYIKQMLVILILLALWSQGVGIWQQSFLITMCCKIILPVLDVINIACLINQPVLFFVTDQWRGGCGIFIVLVLEDVTCGCVISAPSMIDMEVFMQTLLIFSVHVLDQSVIWTGMDLRLWDLEEVTLQCCFQLWIPAGNLWRNCYRTDGFVQVILHFFQFITRQQNQIHLI